MTRKSKDPTAGACASCRKEIPLVPDDQGDLVLQDHHVVLAQEQRSGYEIETCPGSMTQPATLDDSADWAWVAPAVAPPEAAVGAAALSEASQRFTYTLGALGAAYRNAAAATPDTFTDTLGALGAAYSTAAAMTVQDTFALLPDGTVRARSVPDCDARNSEHYCWTSGPHREHRCTVPSCGMTWTNLEAPHGTS